MNRKMKLFKKNRADRQIILSVFLLPFLVYSTVANAIVTDNDGIALVEEITGPVAEHCEDAIASGDFPTIFVCGDEFFEFTFNAADGGGANVGNGQRYTRLPRADLNGPGEWANHFPKRPTGPNAGGCVICHNTPVGTSAGPNGLNVIRDPMHTANPSMMINRNTPHLMGSGPLQLLAEEMTERLHRIRARAIRRACGRGEKVFAKLSAKGVNFGKIEVKPAVTSSDCVADADVDYSNVEGIDHDLVVKPFTWKGSDVSLRKFTVGAFNGEIGMQPVETTGAGVDGDGDGVTDEVSVDDVTATVVYMAGQTRPHTEVELDALRQDLIAAGQAAEAEELGLPALTSADKSSIARGTRIFHKIGCASCHKPRMLLKDPVFREPSSNPNFNVDAINAGLNPANPVSFDVTTDMQDNHIEVAGETRNLANFKTNASGHTIVELFGDLKRHDMGSCLAENIDEVGTGASVWMTKELWGVGATGQYLHDGRATTIEEAILEHCGDGEGAMSRAKFKGLNLAKKKDLVRFLKNLVILKAEEE